MSALGTALDTIDAVAGGGDLAPTRTLGDEFDLESAGEPIALPDERRIYPPRSFFSALARLSAEIAAALEARQPDLFRFQHGVIEDELVDRETAHRLRANELELAILFDHEFEPDPAPGDIELAALFTDPPCILLPAGHRRAGAPAETLRQLAKETGSAHHHGSAARLRDHTLQRTGIRPAIVHSRHSDERVEAPRRSSPPAAASPWPTASPCPSTPGASPL